MVISMIYMLLIVLPIVAFLHDAMTWSGKQIAIIVETKTRSVTTISGVKCATYCALIY